MDKERAQKEFDALANGFLPYLQKKYGWKISAGLGLLIIWAIIGKVITINDQSWNVFHVAIFIYLPIGLVIYWLLRKGEEYRILFWQKFAESRQWRYAPVGGVTMENGLIFTQGEDRSVRHIVEGSIDNRPFKIFTYGFFYRSLENKKYPRTFTVFSFRYTGSSPHLYLDRLHDAFGLKAVGQKLNMPSEFAKQFALYAPAEYEIEALAIYTPELLVALLDQKQKFDIECIEQWLCLYLPYAIPNGKVLLERLNAAVNIMNLLAPKLDRARYEVIANYPAKMV